jgi:hypothetical protein
MTNAVRPLLGRVAEFEPGAALGDVPGGGDDDRKGDGDGDDDDDDDDDMTPPSSFLAAAAAASAARATSDSWAAAEDHERCRIVMLQPLSFQRWTGRSLDTIGAGRGG